MENPTFKVEQAFSSGFIILRTAGDNVTYAGKSMIFGNDEPSDPFESSDEATERMESYVKEFTQAGEAPEPAEEKQFAVFVSLQKEIKVSAADKKAAIEKVRTMSFGDYISWENATAREV